MLNYLNIAALCPSSRALGPGRRFVIWVQGCCFNCHGCGSPEWREIKEATLITPSELADRILQAPDIEGITISGGEPILQARNLRKLLPLVRSQKQLSIICYTGFTLNELQQKGDQDIKAFLAEIDVLIDGPYIGSLNDNLGWRGSANQKVHFLTGVYQDKEEEFLARRRDIEIYLYKSHYLLVGIHPKSFPTKSLL